VLQDLKVEIPELEPPRVLLEQLAQLSQSSTPSAADSPRTVKAFLATVSVTVLATVAWLTGTLPGVASPFTREPATPHPAPQHAPVEPGTQTVSGGEETVPVVAPEPKPKPHRNKGHHNGQGKPIRDNNGLHLGQTEPHQDNGNHYGQTKPHHNNGNHNGQTKPHHNNGQTKPPKPAKPPKPPHGNGNHGGGHGNGHRT
jgi:hypothetical protein